MEFYLADRQGITRAGLMYVIGQMEGCSCKYVEDKCELLQVLSCDEASVVVLDYTLFDFNDQAELLIVSQRFPLVHWVLFSEDLSVDFCSPDGGCKQRVWNCDERVAVARDP